MSEEYNYQRIKELSKEHGGRVTDFLALAPQNDPFYCGTPSDLTKAQWFAIVYNRAGYGRSRAPHLRRVHYWTVSQEPPILMPDGNPYENTEKCWEFLIAASKAARYLQLVPLDGITDNKNPAPAHLVEYGESDPSFEIDVPDFRHIGLWINGITNAVAQPYHLEIWCEKSTMNDVLIPLCEQYNANLVTFEGEVSITSVCVNLMRRIEESGGKPTRIFYISDFDPAGNSMPVAMSRKLEYTLRTYESYDVKVKPIALTTDQIALYRLPRIPIKETEKRAAQFELAFGGGAVELDALEALHPGALAGIVEGELEVFYSPYAEEEVKDQRAALKAEVSRQVNDVLSLYEPQIKALEEMQQKLKAIHLDMSQYAVDTYYPDVDEADDWLFDSDRDYLEQIARYKAHKNG